MADHEHFVLKPEEVEKLARIGATQLEMAAWFGCSSSTIEKRLATHPELRERLEKGYAGFDLSLRRKQAEIAERGNVTMLIWLGKQRLGQRDKMEHTGKDGESLVDAFRAALRGE